MMDSEWIFLSGAVFGLFVGGVFGVFIMCLLVASREVNDDRR